MITIIGTGHVFDIGRPVMVLIKNIWPQAVLVELDVTRYNMMTAAKAENDRRAAAGEAPLEEEKSEDPWIYRRAAKYQSRMAEDHRTNVGGELLVAVNTGKLIGAEIGFIDTDAHNAMKEMWAEMPFREKARYTLSTYTDSVKGKKGADKVAADFGQNEQKMMEEMRRKYPTLVRKLIDERNDHMAEQIRGYAERLDNIVVVCGDAHVEGITDRLSGLEVRKVRLKDLTDQHRLNEIFESAWNHEGENQ